MNLFILAAGLGTRFKPLTLKMPKPTIPFLNVPMGYYNFRFLEKLNPMIKHFVVNTHHLPDQVEALYCNQKFISAQATFSKETDEILGTAGGIKFAAPFFKENGSIIVMNADEIMFTENDDFMVDAVVQHNKNAALATLVVMKHPEAGKKFGAILCEGRSVKNISKTITDDKLEPWHYVGIIILSYEVLNLIEDGKEQNIFYDILINYLDRVQIFPIDAEWFETGNPTDFLKATDYVLNKLQQNPVDSKYRNVSDFINRVVPSDLIKTETSVSLVAKNLNLDFKKLTGFNVINSNVKIGHDDSVNNSVLFADEKLTY
ncbi:MAG: NTP transferase domain-containing protein [Bdellovibrio sp.]|nr:NTP transferase domain-containing protein [Bdellovibrio sp.]